jgi:hypothetical protein
VINNTRDIVPHAWNSTTMNEIPGLYKPSIQPTGNFDELFETQLSKAGPAYTRLGQGGQQQCITGAFLQPDHLNSDGPCPLFSRLTPPQVAALAPFGMEALNQHVCAYTAQLGLPDLLVEEGVCIYLNPGT